MNARMRAFNEDIGLVCEPLEVESSPRDTSRTTISFLYSDHYLLSHSWAPCYVCMYAATTVGVNSRQEEKRYIGTG